MSDATDQSSADAVAWLTDVLYTGIGLGILAINKAQVARRDLEAALAEGDTDVPALSEIQAFISDPDRLARVVERLRTEVCELDALVGGIERRVTTLFQALEPDLPPAAAQIADALRSVVGDHADQIRAALGIEDR